MNTLITNPAFQSGIAPFVIAFILLWFLRKTGGHWMGLGFIAAYYISVYLAVGFQLFPLTSTRKLLLMGAIVAAIGLGSDLFKSKRRVSAAILTAIAVTTAIWVIWPVAKRQEGGAFWLMLASASLYSGWIAAWCAGARRRAENQSFNAMGLGFGTGVSALLGASALLGQLGIAIGAGAAAYVIVTLWKKDVELQDSFIFPVALLSGIIGISGTVYAQLPWYSLIPLGFIPLLSESTAGQNLSFKKIFMLALLTLTPALISIGITWSVAGAPPI